MPQADVSRNTDNLKKELTLPMVFCVALKQVIGGGVIALTGVAIGLTGAGVPIAFILASITSIMAAIPFAILSSAMPVTGGMYTWPARLMAPWIGFITLWFFFLTNVALSLYAITASDYIRVFYPDIPQGPLAFAILTIFYLINLSGAKTTAKVGMVLTFIMASAILLFIGTGLPEVNYAHFENMMPNGIMALMSATGILLFTTGGANMVAELGGEMKNPGRDIPISIIAATATAAIVYVLASIVAAGVLPIAEVADKPLTLVAERIMSRGSFLYFSIGAGIISVFGIINAQMLWGSKSLLVACDDCWLPPGIGAVNKRFGTPHFLLTGLYLVGIFPIITGLSVKEIAMASTITGIAAQIVVIICSYILFRKYRSIYMSAPFKIKEGWLVAAVIIGVLLNGVLVLNLVSGLSIWTNTVMAIWLVIGAVIALARRNHAVSWKVEMTDKTVAKVS